MVMSDVHEQVYGLRSLYRDPLFDRTLEELRSQGGYGAVAAAKADELIGLLAGRTDARGRDKFRFTRKGEYRIRNCRKVDLGCGYRIVCIQKDQRLVLLYIGTHDDCFRWIDRHRTAEYDLESVPKASWVDVVGARHVEPASCKKVREEDRFAEEYEASLVGRLDDAVLRKVFAGIVDGRE
jgi:hypothetical protein